MNHVFQIEGGIGHHFNMSLVFRKFKEQNPKTHLTVYCPWIETLRGNPYIDNLYQINDPQTVTNTFKNYGGEKKFIYHNPNIYRERLHIRSDKHLKQLLCDLCGIEGAEQKDKLDYYPTDEELERAKQFKEDVCENEKLLGIVQCEGTGIKDPRMPINETNILATLKKIPSRTINEVLDKTKTQITWVQIRLEWEEPLWSEYELVNFDQRKIFALAAVCDLGIGTDSMMQHIISGVYDKPFIMMHGRSKFATYGHSAAISIGESSSCPYYPCEFPFLTVGRICHNLDCMTAIKSHKVLTATRHTIKKLKGKKK